LRICQKRSGATVLRSYFDDGFEQGSNDYFYARDHLGSVREVVAPDLTIGSISTGDCGPIVASYI